MAEVVPKGARVKVVKGRKSQGVTGTVFWIGDNKYGEGKRYGIKGDDGATHWVGADMCEAWDKPPEPVEEPDLVRGDRVRFERDGEPDEGEVFWVGPSKHGPGVRVGVKTHDEETLWFDARQIEKVDGSAPAPRPAARRAPPAARPVNDDLPPPPDDLPAFAPADARELDGPPDLGDEPPPWEPEGMVGDDDDDEPPPLADLDWVD
mgnify:CR=1 FL=1